MSRSAIVLVLPSSTAEDNSTKYSFSSFTIRCTNSEETGCVKCTPCVPSHSNQTAHFCCGTSGNSVGIRRRQYRFSLLLLLCNLDKLHFLLSRFTLSLIVNLSAGPGTAPALYTAAPLHTGPQSLILLSMFNFERH